MEVAINVSKAEGFGQNTRVPDAVLHVRAPLPNFDNIPNPVANYNKFFENEAARIEETLHRSLPGGTYDALVRAFLFRKALSLHVPFSSGVKADAYSSGFNVILPIPKEMQFDMGDDPDNNDLPLPQSVIEEIDRASDGVPEHHDTGASPSPREDSIDYVMEIHNVNDVLVSRYFLYDCPVPLLAPGDKACVYSPSSKATVTLRRL